MSSMKLLAVFLLLLVGQGMCWKCDENQTVCEIWLVLDHQLTMMKGKTLVAIKDGLLFPYNTANYSRANAIPKEDVITTDGWAEPRVVIAINGTMPGPLIEVHEQQIVRAHVHNNMRSEAITLHFHGQRQRGTPWMDGVAFVTQCPVLPGQTFTYQFRAEVTGTYWYHAHIGGESGMGAHGGFVVHPRHGASSLYHRQFTLLVEDWNHDWDSTMDFLKMQYGMYVHGHKESAAENLSGAKYSMFRCQSGLINGRGRYRDPVTGQSNGAPLETFSVRPSSVYRFRIVHSGSVYPFMLSVHGHKLKVVATDGMELRDPVMADSVIVSTGERYDFELEASNVVDNYWIEAKTLEVGVDHKAEAILHYEGAAEDTDPVSTARQCTSSLPCVVVNCPFSYFPAEANTSCVNVETLRSAEEMPDDVGVGADKVKEYFLNFAFPGTSFTPASINGIQLQMPTVSALTQPLQVDTRCPGEGYRCAEDEVCRCTSVIDLPDGEVAQFVITNLGMGAGWDHPMHMHGHSFWVLKIGYPAYDNQTGRLLYHNVDVDCRGNPDRNLSFCNNATWADRSWSGNTVPGLELQNPVRKDTVNVPTGGYVVVRIKADNPGLWSMHCHVSLHMEDGMFVLLNESYPNQPPPPPGFPRCGNFDVAPPEE